MAPARSPPMSVYVAGPVDAAPFDQFQLAIYSDDDGGPDRPLAVSRDRAARRRRVEHRAASRATCSPGTAYWLMFNTNGRAPCGEQPDVRRRVPATRSTTVVQAHRASARQLATSRPTSVDDSADDAGRRRRLLARLAARRLAGRRHGRRLRGDAGDRPVACATAVRSVLGSYPSGHALRTRLPGDVGGLDRPPPVAHAARWASARGRSCAWPRSTSAATTPRSSSAASCWPGASPALAASCAPTSTPAGGRRRRSPGDDRTGGHHHRARRARSRSAGLPARAVVRRRRPAR